MVKFIPNKNFYAAITGGGAYIDSSFTRKTANSSNPNYATSGETFISMIIGSGDVIYTINNNSAYRANLHCQACVISDPNNLTNSDLYKWASSGTQYTKDTTISVTKLYKHDIMTGVSMIFQFNNAGGSSGYEGMNCLKIGDKGLGVMGLIMLDEPLSIGAGETVNVTVNLDDIKPDIPETITD